MTEEDFFTTQEVAIEEQRLARTIYRQWVGAAILFFTASFLSGSNAILFIVFRSKLWEPSMKALQTFPLSLIPGSPEIKFWFLVFNFAFMSVISIGVSVFCWRKRYPERDQEFTLAALVRLTKRGGLNNE